VFNFLWILLEVLWRYFWGSLWCWRYLCGTSEPEVGEDLRTAGRSFENKLHSIIRWRAVCIAFSGQLQFGEGVLFILWRYERKLPWFVRNCVRRKLGQSERESLWKMVGMNSLVWEALQSLRIVHSRFLYSSLPVSAFLEWLGLRCKRW